VNAVAVEKLDTQSGDTALSNENIAFLYARTLLAMWILYMLMMMMMM